MKTFHWTKRERAVLSLVALTAAVLLLPACHKDDNAAPTSSAPMITASRYAPLDIGDSWIYEKALLDTNGTETYVIPGLDSVFVSNDTLIQGNTYAVLRHGSVGSTMSQLYSILRDSSGTIVDQSGHVRFALSSTDAVIAQQTVNEVSWVIDWTAIGAPATIAVPMGSFLCREVRSNVHATGMFPAPTQSTRYFRAADVGLVKSRVFSASGPGVEERLVRAHVQ